MTFYTGELPETFPCPFCAHKKDGTPKLFRWPLDKISVTCPICHAVGPLMETEKGAISMWNLRTKPFGKYKELPSLSDVKD